jgi:ferredoxin-NADP reductase
MKRVWAMTMNSLEAKRACGSVSVLSRGVLGLLVALLCASNLRAQTAEEHASHHPPPAAGETPAAAMPPGDNPPGAGMGDMGKMMEGMGKPPPKELYPSLMALPELSPEKRREIEQQAAERMHAGTVQIGQALDALNRGAQSGDYAAMQQASTRLREGIAQLESGITARRALAEGRAPREVALAWFKREMNLSLGAAPAAHGFLGVTPFHLFTMVLLVMFALAMLAMYFFKMRRAAALFGRIEADKGSPPPGAAPELAGGKPPPGNEPPPSDKRPGDKPPPDDKPPSGDKPPPGDKPPSGDEPPSGAKPAAPADKPAAPRDQPAATPPAVSEETSASPLTANWRGQLRVASIVKETPSVKTFRLLPSPNGRLLPFTFAPGQFLNIALWIGGARMNRSYSISSSPTQREYVDLTVRREPRGAVSRHIVDLLKVGDQIEAGGPVGKFTFNGTEADSIVLISGGVGITPMVSITRYLTERSWPGDIFFIYACRTPADFIFADEISALERRNPKLRVAVTMSRAEGTDWKGPRGHLTKELLTQTIPKIVSRRIHLCGPPSMMDSTKALLTELGVAPEQVKTEAFGTPKPSPAAAGTTAKSSASATGPLVTFSKNNKSSKIHVDQTILELSEELGIGIEFSCRVGTCGVCKVKMTSGEVEMAVEDALNPDDKTDGIILACQAKAKSEVTVEA